MRFQDGVGETTCLSQKEECNRMYTLHYDSPLGGILLAADEVGLTGLWFEGEKYFANILGPEQQERETPALQMAKRWLDVYFSGREPDFTPPLHPVGSPFRRAVWELLLQIPYGQTTTYGEIARQLAGAGTIAETSVPQAEDFLWSELGGERRYQGDLNV